MTDRERRGPIKAPEAEKKREAGRALTEAAAQAFPITAGLARLYQTTHPPKSEKDRQDWQISISERSNEHDDLLDRHENMLAPKETIEGLPAQLLARLAQECPDGLAEQYYDLDELCILFPEDDRQSVEDAAFDLKTLSLLNSRDWLGGWAMALDADTYEQIDQQVMGWDTESDAVEIARLMLSEDTGHAPELHKKTGWSKRRFNPAFRHLLPMFPEGRIRRVLQSDYPSLGVILDGEDRANLRRLVAKGDGARK